MAGESLALNVPLICPHCSGVLAREHAVYRCHNGHSFDVAREGYANLRRTKSTGDSAEMLRARRAFLDHGYYAPLADAVCEAVAANLFGLPGTLPDAPVSPPASQAHILDCGCGEGYYLGRMQTHLAALPQVARCRLWGLDSSRDAVRLAARRHHDVGFVVADCKDMVPFATGLLAAVLSIFAPRNVAEFARVLAPGGLWLIVIPAPNHLGELRAALQLISMEEHKLEHVRESWGGLFQEVSLQTVEYALDLDAEAASLLVTMTPSHRHSSEQRLAAIRLDERYRTTVACTVLVCRRTHADAPAMLN